MKKTLDTPFIELNNASEKTPEGLITKMRDRLENVTANDSVLQGVYYAFDIFKKVVKDYCEVDED